MNPFQLKSAIGPATTKVARVWSIEEQTEALKNYIEVPKKYWFAIKYGEHVRYFKKDDGYHPGGLVLQNPVLINVKETGAERQCIKFQSGPNRAATGYFTWIVDYNDLDRVFVKPDVCTLILIDLIK